MVWHTLTDKTLYHPYSVYSLTLNKLKAALQKGVSQEPATTCKHEPQPAKAHAEDTKRKK